MKEQQNWDEKIGQWIEIQTDKCSQSKLYNYDSALILKRKSNTIFKKGIKLKTETHLKRFSAIIFFQIILK